MKNTHKTDREMQKREQTHRAAVEPDEDHPFVTWLQSQLAPLGFHLADVNIDDPDNRQHFNYCTGLLQPQKGWKLLRRAQSVEMQATDKRDFAALAIRTAKDLRDSLRRTA